MNARVMTMRTINLYPSDFLRMHYVAYLQTDPKSSVRKLLHMLTNATFSIKTGLALDADSLQTLRDYIDTYWNTDCISGCNLRQWKQNCGKRYLIIYYQLNGHTAQICNVERNTDHAKDND